MEIRPVNRQEIDKILQLWIELVKNQRQYDRFFELRTNGPEEMKKRLQEYVEDECFLIPAVVINDKIVGYALAQITAYPPFFKTDTLCEIRHMFIKEPFRNKKHGTRLLEYIKSWTHEKGVRRMELLVAADNEQAIKFYRSLGFGNFCLRMVHHLS
jgi:GNAT superfamily N-acetyltransferase